MNRAVACFTLAGFPAGDFEDGSHIIYVNSQRRDDTALGKLMQDLYCTEPKNLHYQEFAERMEFFEIQQGGRRKNDRRN